MRAQFREEAFRELT